MGELFDITETRRALQSKRADLLAECNANSKLQRRFDTIASQLIGEYSAPEGAAYSSSEDDGGDDHSDGGSSGGPSSGSSGGGGGGFDDGSNGQSFRRVNYHDPLSSSGSRT